MPRGTDISPLSLLLGRVDAGLGRPDLEVLGGGFLDVRHLQFLKQRRDGVTAIAALL